MKFNKLIWGTAVLSALVSCGKKPGGIPGMGEDTTPQRYETAVLNQEDALVQMKYPATIKGQEDIEIRPRIDGFIDAILVDEGSVVRKGDVLFKINSPQAIQALNSAKAQISSVQAQMNTAKLNVDRLRPLAEKGIISQVQLETAENAYQTAKAGMDQANAMLKNAEATLSWTNVVSPVSGTVGNIPFRQGSLVNPSNVLTTVANTSNVFAYFSLNEKQLMEFLNTIEGKTQAEKIKNMPPVTLTLADNSEYTDKGKIETISGLVNVSTGSVNFRAEFPNKEGMLRSGTSGNITIPRTLNNVLIIPQKATFNQQDKILAYKVQGDTMVVQKVITVLPMPDGKNFIVTQGLSNGDKIVTDGVVTLKDGKKILTDSSSPKS